MWIGINQKEDFKNSSKVRGLRVTFDKKIDESVKQEVKKFATWLRKKYYFPIRCDIHIRYCSYFIKRNSADIESVGDFYYKENDARALPSIWIAGNPASRNDNNDFYVQIQARIAYCLTFYYQWFFLEFNRRSNRSLKIEATKWQNYLMNEYLNENNVCGK